jgi:hypothetical protein
MPCGRGAFAAGKAMLFINLNTKMYALHAFTLHDSFDHIPGFKFGYLKKYDQTQYSFKM